MSENGDSKPSKTPETSFFFDGSDTQSSSASQPSTAGYQTSFRSGGPPSAIPESPEAEHYQHDDRRPSLASIATASSTGSRTSAQRLRKLQGFFGEEFPGRDSSDNSLPASGAGKDRRHSRSYSHSRQSHRDRKASNATSADQTRDGSPSSSRPRTPVPAPEVVPFLYQDNTVSYLFVSVSLPALYDKTPPLAPCTMAKIRDILLRVPCLMVPSMVVSPC